MTTSTPTVGALEQRLRAGDTTVTPDQLLAARAAEEHARLLAEGQATAAQREAEQERHRNIEALRTELEATFGGDSAAELREMAAKVRNAMATLVTALTARTEVVEHMRARAQGLGLSEFNDVGDPVDDSGIDWSHRRGEPSSIRFDDRVVTSVKPANVIVRLLHEVTTEYDLRATSYAAPEAAPSVDAQLRGVDRPFQPRRLTTLKYLKRHGRHQPGEIATVDSSTAGFALGHGLAITYDEFLARSRAARAGDATDSNRTPED